MLRIIVLFVFLAFANVDANRICGESPDTKDANPDTLVLCPHKFQAAMKTWTDYRARQGHRVTMLTPAPTPKAIKQQIQEVAVSGDLKHVLIVGDSGDERSAPGDLVTTDYVEAKVNVKFGSEPEIATDNTYADLDSDGIPDLTIGRLPIDTVEEIECFTNRIIEYESHACSCDWRRRINFIAGVGGFGQVIDGLIENTTKQMITDLVPDGYETTMTYGSWCSPYCPDPRRFSESAITRFNEGCMFWVYLGHGARHQLDNVRLPDQNHSILDNTMVSKLKCQCGNPIAIFLACYTGATDDPQDCLAETMMRQEDGPIAAICGTRMTMPYAMSLLSLEMVHEFFEGDAKTIGELTLLAKQRMVNGSEKNCEYRTMIEGMGKTFSPLPTMLKQERLEHVQLIHLIGDPLLRLKRPATIEIESPASIASGSQLKLVGKVPAGGKLTLELAYERDRLRHRHARRKEYDSSEASFQDYQQTYEQSQDLVCSSKVITVSEGEFSTQVTVPAEASGRCVVRAMLESENLFAIGSSPIDVKKVPDVRSAERVEQPSVK